MLIFTELCDYGRFVLSHLVCHLFKIRVYRTCQLHTSCYNGFVILDNIKDAICNNGIVRICVVPSMSEFGLGVEERRHRGNTEEVRKQ